MRNLEAMKILFLGLEDSPLLQYLKKTEDQVIQTMEKLTIPNLDSLNPDFIISYRYRHIISKEIVQKAFRQNALKWHPDRHTSEINKNPELKDKFNEKFGKITEAYETLERYLRKEGRWDAKKTTSSPVEKTGGINLNFFPIGPLLRRTGLFFIRRSFKDNELYKIVLRSYFDFLIEKRFPIEWYMEGGRSRSGKLGPPRFGLLHYISESLRSGRADDIKLIPLSIAYDQIQDLPDYAPSW